MATLLQIVTDFCGRKGLEQPAVVVGSAETSVIQIRGLLKKGCQEIADRGRWEGLVHEAVHTTLAQEDQGALTDIADTGFEYILWDTLFDRSSKLRLSGAATADEWQLYKAMVVTGPRFTFRIRQGRFLVIPTPPAGLIWAFEYFSTCFVQRSATDATYLSDFNADDNVILLPEKVVTADLEWRWKKEKGLTYAEDFNSCERMLTNALGRNAGPKQAIRMDGEQRRAQPGIIVPAGSWNVTP